MKDRFYIWFDTEYSSLELENATLLQVAALITDTSLRRVLPRGEDVRLAIRVDRTVKVSQWVRENLLDLLDTCYSPAAVDVAEADTRLAAYVDRVMGSIPVKEEERPVLAGNSVHMDWWLARRFLPRFLTRLHYRNLDVTALKLEWRRQHPHAKEFKKENPALILRYFPEADVSGPDNRHDAYYDVQASIAELAFYRKNLFVKRR